MTEIIARHVLIEGRVQGVGFRAWVYAQARRHGLAGWVRNRLDGSVEALFQGQQAQVMAMIDDCQVGSLASKVSDVRVSLCDVDPQICDFTRKETV